MKVDCSLDKVSLIGDADDAKLWDSFDLSAARAHQFAGGVQLCWDRGGAHVTAQVDGQVAERFLIGEDGGLVYRGGGVRPSLLSARVEFNPNRVSADGLECVHVLNGASRVTRVDAALDYSGISPGDYVWSRPRVKTNAWYGVDGVSEAVYLGRWSSARCVRIYDKARELGAEDMVLTRVESMQRIRPDFDALPDDLFDGLRCHVREMPGGLSLYESGLVALSLYAPDRLREAAAGDNGSRTMRRARDLVANQCAELSPHPAEVYRENRADLLDMLSDVQRGVMVRRAEVYQEKVTS